LEICYALGDVSAYQVETFIFPFVVGFIHPYITAISPFLRPYPSLTMHNSTALDLDDTIPYRSQYLPFLLDVTCKTLRIPYLPRLKEAIPLYVDEQIMFYTAVNILHCL